MTQENIWQNTIIDELMCCHIYQQHHDADPRKALQDIISWNVQVALDPQVSSDAQALIDKGADDAFNALSIDAVERIVRANMLLQVNFAGIRNDILEG
jgi:hypothetical protein